MDSLRPLGTSGLNFSARDLAFKAGSPKPRPVVPFGGETREEGGGRSAGPVGTMGEGSWACERVGVAGGTGEVEVTSLSLGLDRGEVPFCVGETTRGGERGTGASTTGGAGADETW